MKVVVTIHQTELYTSYSGKDTESHDDIVLSVNNLNKVVNLIGALPDVEEVAVEITMKNYDHRDPKPEVSEDGEGE
jgi:hypothetical protein